MNRCVVIDVVGLTPRAAGAHAAALGARRATASRRRARHRPARPSPAPSSRRFLTGLTPAEHGIVGNGWYFRDLGEVFLWRQHNALVQGEKVWETARRAKPGLPRREPLLVVRDGRDDRLHASRRARSTTPTARKSPDCYTDPPALHDELTGRARRRSRSSSTGARRRASRRREWIADAARAACCDDERPDLTLVYLPHLDYDLQRFGPDGPEAVAGRAASSTRSPAPLIDARARARRHRSSCSPSTGSPPARRPVDDQPRAAPRRACCDVYTQAGMEYLDPWTSRAFAVADHQIAHVYVTRPGATSPARRASCSPALAGVGRGARRRGQGGGRASTTSAPASSSLVAEPDAWFTYYYWLDDARAPDFARTVEIHRKPGYDPAELFFDPDDPRVEAAGRRRARAQEDSASATR